MAIWRSNWFRIAIVAAGIGAVVGIVRLGRVQGMASGGEPQAGCGGPPAVENPNPVSTRPAAPKTYKEVIKVSEQAFPGRTGKAGHGFIQTPGGEREVDYREVDGYAIVEGDIAIPLSEVRVGDGRASGAGRSTSSTFWPKGIVYYSIDSSVTNSATTSAISHWETYTNLDFVARSSESSYIKITTGCGCYSTSIGKTSGVTTISAGGGTCTNSDGSTYTSGWCSSGNMIHELGHAIGLFHEQSRSDRDSYVTINWSLISSDWTYQYKTYSAQGYSDGQNLGSYDYGSVMHYPAYCPTDTSKTCITVPSGTTIGQRDGLSEDDIDSVQSLYAGALEQSTNAAAWWGASNQGGGMALADINSDGKPEAIMFHMDDPGGSNYGYYRVAWGITSTTLTNNTATTYRPASYGDQVSIAPSGWWGNTTDGAGVAVGDIDGNGTKDVVVLWVDDPSGSNSTRYRIGWNISSSGTISSWTGPFTYTGGKNGDSTAGADVALYDLNGNGKLDMVVATVDDPSGSNTMYYSVGWDLSTAGAISSYSSTYSKSGWVGNTTHESGLDVADMDGNGTADLVLSWVDDPSGNDIHYWQVGYDLSSSTGQVSAGWSDLRTLGARLGDDNQGADIAVWDFDGNGSKDVMSFHLDPSGTGNTHYTLVTLDQSDKAYYLKAKHSGQCMDVEGNGTSDGTRIQQWGCNSTIAQKFTLSKTDDGYYYLLGKNGGKCVDVKDMSSADHAVIQLYTCNDTNAQKFTLVSDGAGYYSIKNVSSGKCLDVSGFSTTAGTDLIQYTCGGGDNQKWSLTAITN